MFIDSRITRNFVLRPDGDDGDGDAAAKAAADAAAKAAADKAKDDDKGGSDAAFAEMRRELRDAKRRADQAEAKVAEREREEAEKQGKWKELAERADQRVKELEATITAAEQRATVAKAAKRLNFADPEDAYRFLDSEEMADDKLAEKALAALAKAKPYLLTQTVKRTGREVGGDIPTDKDGNPDPDYIVGAGILGAVRDMRARGGSATLTE